MTQDLQNTQQVAPATPENGTVRRAESLGPLARAFLEIAEEMQIHDSWQLAPWPISSDQRAMSTTARTGHIT
jgi:hypothetical protein